MLRRCVLASLVLLGLLSCSTPAKKQKPAPPMLEFRAEAAADEVDAIGVATMQHLGENVFLLPAKRFLIERAWTEEIGGGRTGVHFVIYEEQRDAFRIWTGQQVGRRVAVIHNGQILSMPHMQVALPGEGVISGGRNGLSQGEARRLANALSRTP